MGALTTFSLFLWRSHIDWLIINVLGALGTLWATNCKIETNVLSYGSPFQFIDVRVKLWATSLGSTWVILWKTDGNPMGTWREHIGNKEKKKLPSHLLPKKKKIGPWKCMRSLLIKVKTLSFITYPLFQWYLQSDEILLTLGMKCWNSAFNDKVRE